MSKTSYSSINFLLILMICILTLKINHIRGTKTILITSYTLYVNVVTEWYHRHPVIWSARHLPNIWTVWTLYVCSTEVTCGNVFCDMIILVWLHYSNPNVSANFAIESMWKTGNFCKSDSYQWIKANGLFSHLDRSQLALQRKPTWETRSHLT